MDQARVTIPFWAAAVPIVFLIVLLAINVWSFDDATGGANQIALLLSAAVAAGIGRWFGVSVAASIDGVV